MNFQNNLKVLSEIIGVSGYEKVVRNEIIKQLEPCSHIDIKIDKMGNLICHRKGLDSELKIVLIAHMDEVGFQVMTVGDDGAHVKALGNIKTWNALNQKVSTADGLKQGIIVCEDPEGIKGYEYDRLKAIPITGQFEIGDVLGLDIQFTESDNYWVGKALDNRISCHMMCEILKSGIKNKNDIYCVFSTQEESGMRGARVAIAALVPDIVIDLDVSPVGKNNSLVVGNGVGIKLSDSVGISSEELVAQLEQYAIRNNVSYQREVSNCGTTEMIITNEKDSGAKRIGLSIPCYNMHSSATIVNKKDASACKRLLEIILNNGLSAVN